MKTVALRFSDNYAPEEGMIFLHQQLIDKYGYVWYGKFGNGISEKNINEIMQNKSPRILLINSGLPDRYWAYISDIRKNDIELDKVPAYYRDRALSIKCWFKVNKIEPAEKNVMSKCVISSTGSLLSNSSKHSMNPFFIIDYKEEEND